MATSPAATTMAAKRGDMADTNFCRRSRNEQKGGGICGQVCILSQMHVNAIQKLYWVFFQAQTFNGGLADICAWHALHRRQTHENSDMVRHMTMPNVPVKDQIVGEIYTRCFIEKWLFGHFS